MSQRWESLQKGFSRILLEKADHIYSENSPFFSPGFLRRTPYTSQGKAEASTKARWNSSRFAWSRNQSIPYVEVTTHLILSLTQPVQEGQTDAWQEIILVDDRATDEQATALLDLFEEHLESVPAEVTSIDATKKAVYRASMSYTPGETHPTLHVDFTPDKSRLIRGSSALNQEPIRAWQYDGRMVLRETFDWHKD